MSMRQVLCARTCAAALTGLAGFGMASLALAQAAPPPAQANTPEVTNPEASAPSVHENAPAPELPRGQSSTQQPTTNVEEVVVTARKRAERLIDVPVAANALSGAALNRYAVTDLTAAGDQVPQVQIDHAASGNGAIITVRGVGSASVDASIEQEVTVNIDGVPVSRGRVIQQAFFDESDVDVLKGPQALYFGKNSPAGVIVINSTNPGKDFEGYVRGGYETTTEQPYGEAGVSIPINDTLGIRVAVRGSDMIGGYTRGIGGPITNPAQLPVNLQANGETLPGSPYSEYPGDKDEIARFTVDWKPNEKFDAAVKSLFSNHQDRGDSMAGRMFSCGPMINHPASQDLDFAQGGGEYLVDPYGPCSIKAGTNSYGTIPEQQAATYPGSHGGVPFTQVLTYLDSLTMNYRPTDTLTLTSVTGFYKYRELQFSNYDETDFAAASGQNNEFNTQYTEEVRAETNFRSMFNLTAGFFYEHDDREFLQSGFIAYLPPDPVTGQTNTFGSNNFYKGDTYSGFGELNIKLPYHIELAGGARYTVEDKSANIGSTFVNPFLPIASPAGVRIIGAFAEHNVSPQVTLSWHPNPDTLLYGAYKEGFKSGGFSAPAVIPVDATAQNQQFAQETAEGGEIGLKAAHLAPGLSGDLTLYHYTYNGLQLTAFDAATTSYFTQNAASAVVQGIELNTNYRLNSDFSFHAAVGYNHARYGSFPNAQCWTGQAAGPDGLYAQYDQGNYCVNGVQDLSNKPLSRAPTWSTILGANYDHDLNETWKVAATAQARYSSGYYLATDNNPFGHQNGYITLDVSARLYSHLWEFALIGTNVTNATYAVLGGDKPLGPIGQFLAAVGTPDEFFLQATRHF